MKRTLQVAFVAMMLTVSVNLHAAKGDSKVKKGVVLKFTGFDLKSFNSLNLFSGNAFTLKGNFSTSNDKAPQNASVNSYITLQKGNVTFIYPYKYNVKVPLFKTPVAPKP